MPKKKKLKLPETPDYTGITKKSNDWLVSKSHPLRTLTSTKLTLPEFKILDAYLARVNPRDPEKRFVSFKKGEIEELLGVEKINKAALQERVSNLFQTLEVTYPEKPSAFKLIALFEKAECERDEDGLWQVDLAVTPSAMEYVFNIESWGYFRYRLRNVINITSRYSYCLFLYLEENRNMHLTWEVPVDELKGILNCNSDTYNDFFRFNGMVLKKAYKELNEKTECHFEYEPVRVGKRVKTIRFTLEKQDSVADVELDQLTIEEYIEEQKDNELWLTAVEEFRFSESEIEEIRQNLYAVPEHDLPEPQDAATDSIEFRRYHFMAALVARLKNYDSKKRIRNKSAYLVKMVREHDTDSSAAYETQKKKEADELERELFNL